MPQTTNSTDPVEQENGSEELNCLAGSSLPGTTANNMQHSNANSAHTTVLVPNVPSAPPSTSSSLSPGMPPTGLIKGGPSPYVAGGVDFYRIAVRYPGKDRQQCLCLHCLTHGEDVDGGTLALANGGQSS